MTAVVFDGSAVSFFPEKKISKSVSEPPNVSCHVWSHRSRLFAELALCGLPNRNMAIQRWINCCQRIARFARVGNNIPHGICIYSFMNRNENKRKRTQIDTYKWKLNSTTSNLNFPYFVIITLQMCANCMTQHPFLLPMYSVSAFHIPIEGVTLVNRALALHSVDPKRYFLFPKNKYIEFLSSTFRCFYLMMMLMTSTGCSLSIWRLILIRIAVAWAGRCCITLIIEYNVIRWRRAFQTTAFTFQFQIQATLTASSNFVWRSWAREPWRLIVATHHIVVVDQMGRMHTVRMKMWCWRSIHYICIVVIVATATHFRRCDRTFGTGHRFQHSFQRCRIWRWRTNDEYLNCCLKTMEDSPDYSPTFIFSVLFVLRRVLLFRMLWCISWACGEEKTSSICSSEGHE